jgi:hypothetical protein
MKIFMAGYWLFHELRLIGSVSSAAISKKSILMSTHKLLNAIENILPPNKNFSRFVNDRKTIEEHMKTILSDSNVDYYDRVGVADSLLKILEDRFETTKKWIVFVVSHIDGNRSIEHFQSDGFFTASAPQGLFAAAISVDRVGENVVSVKKSSRWTRALNKLKFDSGESKKGNGKTIYIGSAFKMHRDFSRAMGDKWTGKMEWAVISTPCSAKKEIFKFTTVVATTDLTWTPVAKWNNCSQVLIIAVPV